jgi:hypothetical protein
MEVFKTIITYIPNRFNIYSDSDSDSESDIELELDSDTTSQSEEKKDLEIIDDSVIPNIITNEYEKNLHQTTNDTIIHLDYNSVYTLLNNTEIAYLPEIPKPFEKIQIINLGNKNIKIVSTNETNIFNNFYAPNGNKSILLQKNSTYELIYIKTEEKTFWICK